MGKSVRAEVLASDQLPLCKGGTSKERRKQRERTPQGDLDAWAAAESHTYVCVCVRACVRASACVCVCPYNVLFVSPVVMTKEK